MESVYRCLKKKWKDPQVAEVFGNVNEDFNICEAAIRRYRLWDIILWDPSNFFYGFNHDIWKIKQLHNFLLHISVHLCRLI